MSCGISPESKFCDLNSHHCCCPGDILFFLNHPSGIMTVRGLYPTSPGLLPEPSRICRRLLVVLSCLWLLFAGGAPLVRRLTEKRPQGIIPLMQRSDKASSNTDREQISTSQRRERNAVTLSGHRNEYVGSEKRDAYCDASGSTPPPSPFALRIPAVSATDGPPAA